MDLTIVLPTYNSEKNFKSFLDSLKEQDYQNFYLFLADGGSKDKTIEIIKSYNFNLIIVSTKDTSAEEGINNCLKLIKTKYFCILNSDDILGQKNYLSSLLNALKTKKIDVVFPNFGSIVDDKKKILEQDGDFTKILTQNISPDIGWMANSKVLIEGHFSTYYKVATAYHFLLRIYKKKYVFFREKSVYFFFRMGGHSYKNGALGYIEGKNIALSFGSNKIKVYKEFLEKYTKFVIKYKILKFFFEVRR